MIDHLLMSESDQFGDSNVIDTTTVLRPANAKTYNNELFINEDYGCQ